MVTSIANNHSCFSEPPACSPTKLAVSRCAVTCTGVAYRVWTYPTLSLPRSLARPLM